MSNNNQFHERMVKYCKSSFILFVVSSMHDLLISKEEGDTLKFSALVLSVCVFHEIGRQRRPGANFISNRSQTILPPPDAMIELLQNGFFNVINGGGAVFDNAVTKLSHLLKK